MKERPASAKLRERPGSGTVARERPASARVGGLGLTTRATIHSYMDQLRFGSEAASQVLACIALGNLAALLPPGMIAMKVAIEEGAWDAMVEAISKPQDSYVLESVHAALSRLIFPGPEGEAAAYHHLNKAAASLLQDPRDHRDPVGQEWVLHRLAAQLATAPKGSRSVLSISRLIVGLSPFIQEKHDPTLLDSGLIDTLLARIGQPDVARDGAACALAAFALAVRTPGLFNTVLRAPVLRANSHLDSQTLEGDHSQSYVGAEDVSGSTLFGSLRQLYARVLEPDEATATPVTPADVVSLLLQALDLTPNDATMYSIGNPAVQKLLLRRLLDGGALPVLVSFIAVESGNLQQLLGDLWATHCEQLQAAAVQAARLMEEGVAERAELKMEHKRLRTQLQDACIAGRQEEAWAVDAAARLQEITARGRALRASQAALQAHIGVLGTLHQELDAWGQAHGQVARKQGAARVRRSPPRLAVLKQVLDKLAEVMQPPIPGANKTPDREVASLKSWAHAQVLSARVLPAALQLHAASQAAGALAGLVASSLERLGVGLQVSGLCGGVLGVMQKYQAGLEKLTVRLQKQIKQVAHESHLVEKALVYGTSQGNSNYSYPLQPSNPMATGVLSPQVEERAQELSEQGSELNECLSATGTLSATLNEYTAVLMGGLQEVATAGRVAADSITCRVESHEDRIEGAGSSPRTPVQSPRMVSPGVGSPVVLSPGDGSSGIQEASGAVTLADVSQLLPQLAELLQALNQPRNALAMLQTLISGGSAKRASPLSSFATASATRKVFTGSKGMGTGAQRPGSARPLSAGPGGGRATSRPASANAATQARPTSAVGGATQFTPQALASSPGKPKFSSNYTDVVFTQSPVRGHHPRGIPGLGPAVSLAPPLPTTATGLNQQGEPNIDEMMRAGDVTPEECILVLTAIRSSALLQPAENGLTGTDPLQLRQGPQQQQHDIISDLVGEGEEQPPVPLVLGIAQQASDLAAVLQGLAILGSTAQCLGRRALLLPCHGLRYDAPGVATALRRRMPAIMRMLAGGLSRHGERVEVVDAITELARAQCTEPADYQAVYVDTGLVNGLVGMLEGSHVQAISMQAHQAREERLRRQRRGEAPGSQGLGAEGAGGDGSSPRETAPSRYDMGPSVSRLSGPTVALQAAVCRAIRFIAERHPEALVTTAGFEEGLASIVGSASDHSHSMASRLEIQHLLACLMSGAQAGHQDVEGEDELASQPASSSCVDAFIAAGGFASLLAAMGSDHRQGSGGAKQAAVVALTAVASVESLREDVASASGKTRGSESKQHRTAPPSSPGLSAGQPLSQEQVLNAVLQALWGVPFQLYRLMSSERTKQGRYVDPAVVRPLIHLASCATRHLIKVVNEELLARRQLQAMGVRTSINITFLQSIKDAQLHKALLELKTALQN